MQRLLKDAEKISGQKYDISNLNDVYNAIHVIQEDLGITGTTAKEASETLSGSFESMKSAAKNLMADLVNGRDVESSLKGLLDTSVAFLFKNLVPAAMQVVKLLPGLAVQLVKEGVPALLKAIGDALPDMFNSLIEMVNNFGNMIIEWLDNFATNPSMQNEGIQMVVTIVKGLIEGIPRLTAAIFKMQVKIVEAFVKAAPSMLKAGLHLIGSLAEGMWKGIKTKVKSVIDAIKDFFPIHIGKLLKGLQLPHFSLEWGTMDFGPLGKLNYPRTLGVNWYKSGGIFSSPTIAGIGEAGSEAVVPLDKLWEKFDQLSAIVERNSRTVNQTINFNTPVNSPIETARLLKNQQKLGLAGV